MSGVRHQESGDGIRCHSAEQTSLIFRQPLPSIELRNSDFLHSMFSACSRSFSISVFISIACRVISKAHFRDVRGLGEQSVGLAIHLLKQKIELLAYFRTLAKSWRIWSRWLWKRVNSSAMSEREARYATSCAKRRGPFPHCRQDRECGLPNAVCNIAAPSRQGWQWLCGFAGSPTATIS